MNANRYEELVRRQVAGRKLVFVGGPLAAYREPMLRQLIEAGAEGILIAAVTKGTGELPPQELADHVVIPLTAETLMGEFRAQEEMMAAPPAALLEALDRWDPDGAARILGTPFISVKEVGGRPVYGGRPPEFFALEDKMVADHMWREAGIEHPPSERVPVDRGSLENAHRRLASERGTVWALDASRGWHGGSEGIFWVPRFESVTDTVDRIRSQAEQVRVTPFLEGIPCSIHGIVFPQRTITFRPCEILVLRRPSGEGFVYAGSGTTWDPEPSDREEMRRVASAVGETLRRLYDYRGFFTVDGVMSEEGFRPTELNTRMGSAFTHVSEPAGVVPWGAIQRALIEREPYQYQELELEKATIAAADQTRSVRGMAFSRAPTEKTQRLSIRGWDGGYRLEGEEEDAAGADAMVTIGPAVMGRMALVKLSDGQVPMGSSAAPAMAAALQAVAPLMGPGDQSGPLEPARDVRRDSAGSNRAIRASRTQGSERA